MYKCNSNEAENGGNESIANKDDYDPFPHRIVEHPNSTVGAFINLLKGIFGTGILAMPYAFKNSGLLLGCIGTAVIACICGYSLNSFVKSSQEIRKRGQTPVLGYAETVAGAFKYGPQQTRRFSTASMYFVYIIFFTTCFLSQCAYVVFIAENLLQVITYWFPGYNLSISMCMLYVTLPLLLLTQIRELKHLVPFSFLANVSLVSAFSIMLYYMFHDVRDPETRNLFTSFSTFPTFVSIVIFAIDGTAIVMPIENSMKNRQHFLGCPGVLNTALITVTAFYTTLGFFGYLQYGDHVKGSITLNLPVKEVPAQMTKLFIAVSVFFSCSLLIYIMMDIVWTKFLSSRVRGTVKKNFAEVILRCTIGLVATGVALVVPNLEVIIGLIGSICSSTTTLLIPSVVQTVLFWNENLGIFKWKLIVNILIGTLSIFVLVIGTAQSLSKIID